jgi:hypothetical protein
MITFFIHWLHRMRIKPGCKACKIARQKGV